MTLIWQHISLRGWFILMLDTHQNSPCQSGRDISCWRKSLTRWGRIFGQRFINVCFSWNMKMRNEDILWLERYYWIWSLSARAHLSDWVSLHIHTSVQIDVISIRLQLFVIGQMKENTKIAVLKAKAVLEKIFNHLSAFSYELTSQCAWRYVMSSA